MEINIKFKFERTEILIIIIDINNIDSCIDILIIKKYNMK